MARVRYIVSPNDIMNLFFQEIIVNTLMSLIMTIIILMIMEVMIMKVMIMVFLMITRILVLMSQQLVYM